MEQPGAGDRHQSASKIEQETGRLDIQLGMRLPWCSPKSRFLTNLTYTCVVTRYGPLPHILKNMGVAMEVARFSHRNIDKALSILDSVRITPLMEESLLV